MATATTGTAAGSQPPPQPFQPLVQQLLDSYLIENDIAGAAAGVAYHGHFYAFTAGVRDRDTGAPMTEETIFPLGSITKIFTGIMLAYLANEGSVSLDDPIVDYLPAEVSEHGGAIRQVTLLDLATHTSGMTDGAAGSPSEQVYFDLPPLPDLIEDWITWAPTPPEPGDPYLHNYSNKGFITLAFAVAEAGKRGGYNPLCQEVFRDPLGLRYLQTRGTMTPEMLALLTKTYGAGEDPKDQEGNGVNANLVDLEKFLKACLLNVGTPQRLKDALEFSMRPFRSKLKKDEDSWTGLGWELQLEPPYTVAKNGATAGAFSVLRFQPQDDFGVIVMANGKTPTGSEVGRVAREILELIPEHSDRELARARPTSHSNGEGKNRANDGDKTSARFWSASGPNDWWQVDLESIQSIGYLHVIPLWDGTTGYPYQVWTSLDGADWTLATDASVSSGLATLAGDGHVLTPRFARYVRVQSSGVPLQLVEFEVFESANRSEAALNFARPAIEVVRGPDPSDQTLRYSYRRLAMAAEVRFAVAVSEDLETWEPIETEWGSPTIEAEPGGLSELVSWQIALESAGATTTRFVRLTVQPHDP